MIVLGRLKGEQKESQGQATIKEVEVLGYLVNMLFSQCWLLLKG